MYATTNLLKIDQQPSLLFNELEVLHQIERSVPGSVQYSITRYKKHYQWSVEDTGKLIYHFEKTWF
jgi:hypothetical protein